MSALHSCIGRDASPRRPFNSPDGWASRPYLGGFLA